MPDELTVAIQAAKEEKMTLDEAVAKYNKTVDGMHCFDPKECQMCAEDKVALDAAVRDVALAAVYQRHLRLYGHIANAHDDTSNPELLVDDEVMDDLNRLLPEGSGKGEE